MRRLLTILILLSAATAADARAAALRWEGTTVRYRSDGAHPAAVRQAVRWINDLPGPLRLVRGVGGIRVRDVGGNHPWAGLTEISYDRRGRIAAADVMLSARDMDTATRVGKAEIAAHELLHAVGVPHLSGCSLMGPYGIPPGACAADDACGPQPRDLRAVQARYGGRRRGFDGYRC